MTSEKKSVSEDSNMTDYANLAFNPYAISTDDLTFSTFDGSEPTKNGKPMENGGFQPEPFVETNPHYEDTAEVVKKAGLGGTGRRKKENVVYEAAGLKKKPKNEKPPEPPRTLNIPPRPAEDWSGISKNTNTTRWKLPFLILCILVVICLIGTALGVLAYFDDKECSCNNNSPQTERQIGGQDGNFTTRLNNIENEFAKNFREIFARLDTMNAVLDDLQKTQQNQEKKLTQTNETTNMVQKQLKTEIETINLTFNMKLQIVNYNISSLSKDIDELRNISKQMGPRGFNGTQGLQGPRGFNGTQGLQGPKGEQGIGNLSACKVHEKFKPGSLAVGDLGKVTVTSDPTPEGWMVMSAVCTTKEGAGTIHNVLSKENNQFKCTCAGGSTYSSFTPTNVDTSGNKEVQCGIIYWECPELT